MESVESRLSELIDRVWNTKVTAPRMSLVSAYSHESGARLEIHRADAFDLTADALIFGRCPPLKARIEAAAGCTFQPYECKVVSRALNQLESPALPWTRALSIDYHPRRADPECMHLLRLLTDLTNLIWWLRTHSGARRMLFLPLSCRNPEVVALATVTAIWHQCYGEMTRNRFRPDLRLEKCTYLLADLYDPAPFQEVLSGSKYLDGDWLKHRPEVAFVLADLGE